MHEAYTDTNAGLHYDLHLEIDPQTNYVGVSGSVAYRSPQNRLERARFYLHRQFEIIRVEGQRVYGYHFGVMDIAPVLELPQAGVLDFYFNPPLDAEETALIQFEYQGYITEWAAESANVITPDWAELGMYLPWFPLQYSNEPSNLTFTLKVKCPAEYHVSSLGASNLQDGSWSFNWPYPTRDIVVAAGRSLEPRIFESDTNRVFLSSASLGQPAAVRLGEDMLWTLERFSGWFGPTRPADFTLIQSPRAMGGGYARRGLVVLSGMNERDYLDQQEAYLRYLSHEAAHGWWWQAPNHSWHDWLNESFAEFSALLAVRERYGPETYERFLANKRKQINGLGPLWAFDRTETDNIKKQALVERMLYHKGPLLLNDLCERMGYKRFLEFCRACLWSGVTDTEHLLELLEEIESRETRQWMEERLKTG